MSEQDSGISLPVLSMWEPWATLVMLGLKEYETRGWELKLRGQLVIHAAKKKLGRDALDWRMTDQMLHDEVRYRSLNTYGCALGVVEVIDVMKPAVMREQVSPRELLYGDWRDVGDDGKERYVFRFTNVRKFPNPVPLIGHQGVFRWTVPNELMAELC